MGKKDSRYLVMFPPHSISHTKLHVSRQNQPLCRGWYLRFIKTRQHLAQLGAADASPLSLITDPERLTKGRIAWVHWRLTETCRAARLESVTCESVWGWVVHLKSTCSSTASSCPARSCCGLHCPPPRPRPTLSSTTARWLTVWAPAVSDRAGSFSH